MLQIKCKDFEIKGFRKGSQLRNQPEYAYKVIYHAEDGRSLTMKETFYTKKSAQEFISKMVKKANNTLKGERK